MHVRRTLNSIPQEQASFILKISFYFSIVVWVVDYEPSNVKSSTMQEAMDGNLKQYVAVESCRQAGNLSEERKREREIGRERERGGDDIDEGLRSLVMSSLI